MKNEWFVNDTTFPVCQLTQHDPLQLLALCWHDSRPPFLQFIACCTMNGSLHLFQTDAKFNGVRLYCNRRALQNQSINISNPLILCGMAVSQVPASAADSSSTRLSFDSLYNSNTKVDSSSNCSFCIFVSAKCMHCQ